MGFVLLVLLLVGVWLFCLFDVLGTDETDVRHLPKFGWFLVVLLGFLLGAAAWLTLGRPRRPPQEEVWPLPGASGSPKGPDDDPAFLRDLDRRLRDEE
ncbi:PLDc N-terminal domain-containing protein [Spirillospora sp. NPDC047279]|uniref:PLDc N-terminal domain-containing protein n=1 Tax=Spirillospora sp. NPDC047279 TaxID=3155478 RepID=UPI0033C8299E